VIRHISTSYAVCADEFGAPDGVQELLRDSFLQVEIPESLNYGTFAGEARLYTLHAIKPA
jgi:hypothetical protein